MTKPNPAPETAAGETPARRYPKHTGRNYAESEFGKADVAPPAEPEKRVRVKTRDHTIAARLPNGERLHLVGDGTIYTLPASVVKELGCTVEEVAPEADMSAGDALVATLVEAARKPGAFESLMGRVRKELGA